MHKERLKSSMAGNHTFSVREFVGEQGKNSFRDWFSRLDPNARSHVERRLSQMRLGNLSDAKSVGEGVIESRIKVGPGYRIYFGRDGAALVVLLAGGTKDRQERDIANAQRDWKEYKQRRRASLSAYGEA